jgi:DNA-binding MarR family transcriptional regulator
MTPTSRSRPRSSASPADAASTDPDAVRAMDALRRMVRALSTSAREASSAGGLSGAHLFVLRQIGARPGLSFGQLAASTLSRQSTVSEVVSRLVERGLVARESSVTDARQAELSLTARGRRAVAGFEATAQERLADGLATMPLRRRRALADALEAWLAAAGLADVRAGMFFDDHAPTPQNGARKRPARRAR